MRQKQRHAQHIQPHGRQLRHQRHLDQQRHGYGNGAEGTHTRILHDVKRTLALVAPAQTIGHIGQTVFVKGTGEQNAKGRADAGHDQRTERALGQGQQEHGAESRHQQPDQPAHTREMRGTGAQHLRAVADPGGQPPGHRQAGEKLQGQQVVADESAHGEGLTMFNPGSW